MKLTIFDTHAASLNTGDAIIMEACERIIGSIFPQADISRFPTHIPISASDFMKAQRNDFAFLCGTNAFRRKWRLRARKNQWALSGWQLALSRPVISLGVGWNSYNTRSGKFSQLVYKNLLRKKGLQSVRDEFTADTLRRMGVKNVVNTGCPTMWGLTPDYLSRVPAKKSGTVIFTLTDYKMDRSADTDMIGVLAREYDRVLFWPQGSRDTDYFASLDITCKVDLLEDGLGDFDRALSAEVDFVGTRLHAGIRALQKARRSIIVSIDNRADEMHRDFNIPIVRRGDIAGLVDKIRGTWIPEVVLPQQNIDDWIGQFATKSR